MSNFWLVVGSPRNWETAFEHKNIWGLKQTQRHLWESMNEKDVVLFYVTSPVSGIIGHGTVRIKFHQDQPLWPQEIEEKKVIWPWRFEFNVERCLPRDKWQISKITSGGLFPRGGFQALSYDIARQLISKFTSLPKGYSVKIPTPESVAEDHLLYPGETQQAVEVPLHKKLQNRLVEIGKLQGFLAEAEYPFDIGRIDVVWRRIERSVPTYVFEVQIGGDLYHALAKLKHAFDLWNSRLFLISSQADQAKSGNLLSGAFHEIGDRVKFIELDEINELYKRKKAYLDFEKGLGI